MNFHSLAILYSDMPMKYIFENKQALDMYYELIKEIGINAEPPELDNNVYITEQFMKECFNLYISKYSS